MRAGGTLWIALVLGVAVLGQCGSPTGCAMGGCDATLSYNARFPLPNTPMSIAWKLTSDVAFSGDGCVSNSYEVLCPTKGGFFALLGNGTVTWTYSGLAATPYLPLETYTGDALMATPEEQGLVFSGGSLAWEAKAQATGGASYPPTLTVGGIEIATTKNGLLWGYDTRGTPFASIWLNYTTTGGTDTTCHPAAQSALDISRIYTPVQCSAHGASQQSCALLAVDQLQTLINKLRKVWKLEIPCGSQGNVFGVMVSTSTIVAFGSTAAGPTIWGVTDKNTTGQLQWVWSNSSSALGGIHSWASEGQYSHQAWVAFKDSPLHLSLNTSTGDAIEWVDASDICSLPASYSPASKLIATPIKSSDSTMLITVMASQDSGAAYLVGIIPSQKQCAWKVSLPWSSYAGQVAFALYPDTERAVAVLAQDQLVIGVSTK